MQFGEKERKGVVLEDTNNSLAKQYTHAISLSHSLLSPTNFESLLLHPMPNQSLL
jgi:hypothetical protein